MASTNRSEKLDLSLWEQTDKPEWSDFLHDNQKLEELVGAHLAASELHLTATEKDYLKKPYRIVSYQGNGNASASFSLGLPRPTAVFVFANGKPPIMPRSDGSGIVDCYWQFWVKPSANSTAQYRTGGIEVTQSNSNFKAKNGFMEGYDPDTCYQQANAANVRYVAVVL